MKQALIFVGGAHGVGKGTTCKMICQIVPFIHISASTVLKWEEFNQGTDKRVSDFRQTQDRLLQNLPKFLRNNSNHILDGHFTLLDKCGNPEKIPFSTFQGINPNGIVILKDQPKIIIDRLSSRDSALYDESTILEMQNLELTYGTEVAQRLGVPSIIAEPSEIKNVTDFLRSLCEF